ncbi:tyrosine kinase catalytic domain protein [Rhizoctonia solani AG-3 Rhs1AP]|uniref:Tyrosine kinase catalytic domain protein n=1 Tax=Rhizoctonia solani AG-3 Rhs1AP TaxID=1086054 RepID=X8J3N6_9AGAM|nr:tyrosine kinase catalytic domain protein [Rhizoctonia solani AG-3 Rhs1AP]
MDLDNKTFPADSPESALIAKVNTRHVPVGSKFLARGAAMDVWLTSSPNTDGRKYVIKVIRVDLSVLQENHNPRGPRGAEELWDDFVAGFRSRVEKWKVLQHHTIVGLFDVHQELDLHVEFCASGTASQYLDSHSENHIQLRKHMITDVLAGMEYLHSQVPPVVHGCLCMDKLLVDGQGRTKISEFGVASLAEEFGLSAPSISPADRARWSSPELLNADTDDQLKAPTCTIASDVWALGCTLFEILSGKVPYFKLKHDLRVQQAILSKRLPGQQDNLDPEFLQLWPLLTQCWAWTPEHRPTVELLRRLPIVQDIISSNSQPIVYHDVGRPVSPGLLAFQDLNLWEGDDQPKTASTSNHHPAMLKKTAIGPISGQTTKFLSPRPNTSPRAQSLSEIKAPTSSDAEPLSSDTKQGFPFDTSSIIVLSSDSDDGARPSKHISQYTFLDEIGSSREESMPPRHEFISQSDGAPSHRHTRDRRLLGTE